AGGCHRRRSKYIGGSVPKTEHSRGACNQRKNLDHGHHQNNFEHSTICASRVSPISESRRSSSRASAWRWRARERRVATSAWACRQRRITLFHDTAVIRGWRSTRVSMRHLLAQSVFTHSGDTYLNQGSTNSGSFDTHTYHGWGEWLCVDGLGRRPRISRGCPPWFTARRRSRARSEPADDWSPLGRFRDRK